MTSDLLHWAEEPFLQCYYSIKDAGDAPESLLLLLKDDLKSVLKVPAPNIQSETALTAGSSGKPVKFHNGDEFKLNEPFIVSAGKLATELHLDQLCAAELLQQAASTSFAQGSSAYVAAVLLFLRRYTYILNILGFYISEDRIPEFLLADVLSTLFPAIMASFTQLYSLANTQNDLIDKQKAVGDVNNLHFVNTSAYIRQQIFEIHDLLAQILFALIDNHMAVLGNFSTYSTITQHIDKNFTNDYDLLIVHYFPSLLRMTTGLLEMSDDEVKKFHSAFATALNGDFQKVCVGDEWDISRSSLKPYFLLSQLSFFTSLIPWCKESAQRQQQFNFEKEIVKYSERLINYGSFELLLAYAAECANRETKLVYEDSKMFDFRPLLQKSIPKLRPTKILYPGAEELLRVAKAQPALKNLFKLCDHLSLTLSATFCDYIVAPLLHSFFDCFINHAAIVLTLLRDSEEDFLLSSTNKKQLELALSSSFSNKNQEERAFLAAALSLSGQSTFASEEEQGLDLDEMSARAELERFYLACTYTYSYRPELCQAFWDSDESNVLGFISWGLANNTSPLITATFCLFLSSLTYGGPEASSKTWDILSRASYGRKNDFSKILIDSIVDSLSYYTHALTENLELDLSFQARINQEKQESLFSGSKRASASSGPLLIQLSEDSVVYIAGFLILIAAIVENSDDSNGRYGNIRHIAFNRFLPTITSFLKFDNLITSAKSTSRNANGSPIVFNDENRSTLLNLILCLLSNFTNDDKDSQLNSKIWVLIDKWICHSLDEVEASNTQANETTRYTGISISQKQSTKPDGQKMKSSLAGISMKKGFSLALTNVTEVFSFVRLIENLLKVAVPLSLTQPVSLLYPADLGTGYRKRNQIGIWPYIEFLLMEVFGNSPRLSDGATKRDLQRRVLSIMLSSLEEIDWNFLIYTAPKVINDFEKFEQTFATATLSSGEDSALSFKNFARLHHSLSVLNYLFEAQVNESLFSIIDETTNDDSNSLDNLITELAVQVLEKVFLLQKVFVQEILPNLKDDDNSSSLTKNPAGYGTSMSLLLLAPKAEIGNIHFPDSFEPKSLTDFFDILLFHIPSVTRISTLVGSLNNNVALSSLKILKHISQSSKFLIKSGVAPQNSWRHRLLTIYENVDESNRIKYSFVQQMEAVSGTLKMKYEILRFLIANLNDPRQITVAHYLLGFEIRAERLYLGTSDQSLQMLPALLSVLNESISSLCDVDYSHGHRQHINHGPAKLAALILEVFVRLCKNSLSAQITLGYLRQSSLFEQLLKIPAKPDPMTFWKTEVFDGNLENGRLNRFIADRECCETFESFLTLRNLTLQYLSLEFHAIKSLSIKEAYVQLLLDGREYLDGTPRILSFLDVFNFQTHNLENFEFSKFENKLNVGALFVDYTAEPCDGQAILENIVTWQCKVASSNLSTDLMRSDFANDVRLQMDTVAGFFQKKLFDETLGDMHVKLLHSWVQIVQILANDGVTKKANFIQNVLMIVLPKINEGLSQGDNQFVEELISLCVFLFDLYQNEGENKLDGLLPLFKTCVAGVTGHTSAGARSNLYLILNRFVRTGLKEETLLNDLLLILRAVDRKFIGVLCNDSIYSEGVPRITSIILIEALISLSLKTKSQTILDAMAENNWLPLLVQSLKRADEVFADNSAETPATSVSLDTVLYELTALKTTLYALIRIGQTREGASQLLQNEIFHEIERLQFLAIDPDLGLSFSVQSGDQNGTAALKLALDIPVTLNLDGQAESGRVSYCEILVPVFQLVATVLITMGPSYKPGIVQVRRLMRHFHCLIVGVTKREVLMEAESGRDIGHHGDIQEMVRLFVLIESLISHAGGKE